VAEAGAVPFPGYRLLRLRGRGGFATVWEAQDPAGERIAMKFMSSANVSVTARELRSLQTIQTLVHLNLLRIREVWSIPGTIAIAMDLADASILDLHELYVEEFSRLIEPEKLGLYLFQAAQALDFLNARRHRFDGRLVGLQHGDIKPNNILLVGDQAKLADYGLATPTSGPMTPCPRHGTAEYCAPEVFQGFLSEKSDQFSLAVTYCVLRTGLFPYPAPPADREQLRNYVRPDPDLSALPPAEATVLARALSPIPQNRYPTCIDLIQSILTVQGLKVVRNEDGSSVKVHSITGEPSEVTKSKQFKIN
jgi:serine/threonine protein kinase